MLQSGENETYQLYEIVRIGSLGRRVLLDHLPSSPRVTSSNAQPTALLQERSHFLNKRGMTNRSPRRIISTRFQSAVSEGRRTAAGMKKNEWVNPFSVSEILRVTRGQTRVNLLSFNQFSTWQVLLCVPGASSVAEADDSVDTWDERGDLTMGRLQELLHFNILVTARHREKK